MGSGSCNYYVCSPDDVRTGAYVNGTPHRTQEEALEVADARAKLRPRESLMIVRRVGDKADVVAMYV